MTLKRVFDATLINTVLNHSEVRELAGAPPGADDIDVSPKIEDMRNVCLMTSGGGFLLLYKTPNTYELHTQFLPEARGAEPLKAVEDAFLYMFIQTDCLIINTKVHKDNVGALKITEQYAELVSFHDDNYFFTLTYENWVKRSNRCKVRGELFHEQLGEDKNHDDDEIHDRNAGSAILMAEAGNIDKSVFVYNRWAESAGYMPLVILSHQPVVIRVDDLMMTRQPDMTMGVTKWRLGEQ